MYPRAKTAVLLVFLAASLLASLPSLSQRVLAIHGLGQGLVELGGPWEFHLGDNPDWALPSFNDSGWKTISTSSSWGSQSDPAYTGYAWYRRHVQIDPIAGVKVHYALLMPQAEDVYEVYWNGKLIGRYGQMPPHSRWYFSPIFRMFAVPSATSGTIAIRVWKAPLLFVDPASIGGLYGAPLLGDRNAIAAQLASIESNSMQQLLYQYTLLILYGFVTLLSLVLWSRDRKTKLFLWLAVFTAMPVLLWIIRGLFSIPISYRWGWGLNQPLYALAHISLWYLLLWLLCLNDNRTLVRWTNGLAIVTFAAGVLDGSLAFFWGGAGLGLQTLDAVLTTIILVAEVFPIVIVAIGVRQHLDSARWWVAISALVTQMIDTFADLSTAGQRFTHWTVFQTVNTPIFIVRGVQFNAADLSAIALFISILYAVYRYSTEQQARQNVLEHEMQSAREIQRVLIPETLPSLEGFSVTSAYRPALEVGGDFFQIISEEQGSTIVALGDVSGKGLKAAMNVSLIVGVLRSMSDASFSPVHMLERLNRCLYGRLQGGFVTAVVLRLHPDGSMTLANAGHLPPFLNQHELQIEGSLPLGLVPSAMYDEVRFELRPGDQLSLYTDGVLEARSATGELYGFDRLHHLFAARPTAEQASEAAVAFGQEDDITVLTLTRLAAGEESTTSLTAPFLEPSPAEA